MAEEEQQQPTGGADEGGGEDEGALQTAQKSSKGRLESSYYSVISRATADGKMVIGEDMEVFPGKECPELASLGTRAYEARDRRLSGEQFVLLCDPVTVPRVTMIGSYKSLKNPNIIKLLNAGIVNWAPEHRQKFVFAFEKPQGKKVQASPEAPPIRISEDRLVPAVIEPVIQILSDFRDIDFVHGAINAENIYLSGAEGSERVVLGECLSSAPSWRQHPLYETSARAVAQASGRGIGTIRDDLYALGICVAMMARGENLLLGKSPQQIVQEKMEHGSFGAVIGRDKVTGGIIEFLRGVLNDDEDQRWDVNDAQRWLEGRRANLKQSRVVLEAARPLVFHEKKYWDLRPLAQAFSENITEAAVEVEKGQFEVWLKRNFEDKALEARFGRMWAKEKDAARERMVSCICMALDPLGPVRYKNLSLFPGGLGMALAQAIARGEDIQVYGELITQQLLNAWISQSFDEISDAAGLLSQLEKCRSALTQKMPGYGIERVLYMLNMEVACLSPILRDHFVLMPGSLLLALEDISQRADRPETILDRHMVAFISVREPKMIDPHLGYVNSRDRGNHMVGVIRTLAAIQRRFVTGPVPGVCGWLISQTGPVIELLNDRDLRRQVSQQLGTLKDSGSLAALLDVVDDSAMVRDDAQGFAIARLYYKNLVHEKNKIEDYLKNRRYFGRATGRQAAMLLSVALATVVIVGYTVLHLMKII